MMGFWSYNRAHTHRPTRARPMSSDTHPTPHLALPTLTAYEPAHKVEGAWGEHRPQGVAGGAPHLRPALITGAALPALGSAHVEGACTAITSHQVARPRPTPLVTVASGCSVAGGLLELHAHRVNRDTLPRLCSSKSWPQCMHWRASPTRSHLGLRVRPPGSISASRVTLHLQRPATPVATCFPARDERERSLPWVWRWGRVEQRERRIGGWRKEGRVG